MANTVSAAQYYREAECSVLPGEGKSCTPETMPKQREACQIEHSYKVTFYIFWRYKCKMHGKMFEYLSPK